MKFRKDINGLRAFAVLPVLFFHASWGLFPGGFLGVDVFFVISGFLITSLIVKDLEAECFSIVQFYNRRARRILPALLFVVLITTILSFVFMLPYDLKNYGQSLVATMLSANNILLYLTSGYWALATEFKPLYHTWSLGVEEQYYLAIPMLFMVIYWIAKSKIKATFLLVLTLFVGSWIVSFKSDGQELNFLMISHRMWELLAGSLVAIILINKAIVKNNLIAILGLLLIFSSYLSPFLVSNIQAVYNLIPVLGTMLIIVFSSDDLRVGRFLSYKPIFLIGTLSYGIYLFHMPILAFLRLSLEGSPSVFTQLIFTSLSIPLAYISWMHIERKFKDKNIISNKLFWSVAVILSFLLISLGLILHKTYGFQEYSPKFGYGINPQVYADRPFKLNKGEGFTLSSKKNLLIIGDSFARDFTNMMIENDIEKSHEIIYIYVADIHSNIQIPQKLTDSADIVIVVSSAGIGNVTVDSKELKSSSKKLYNLLKEASNGNFFLIGTKNFGRNNNFVLTKTIEELKGYKVKVNDTTLKANVIEREIWKDKYIDILGAISTDGIRVPLFTPNGDFISFDTEHITKKGAIYLGNILLQSTALKNAF